MNKQSSGARKHAKKLTIAEAFQKFSEARRAQGLIPYVDGDFFGMVRFLIGEAGLSVSNCARCIRGRGMYIGDDSRMCSDIELSGKGCYSDFMYETTLQGLIAVLHSDTAMRAAKQASGPDKNYRKPSEVFDISNQIIAELRAEQGRETKYSGEMQP